MSLHCNNCGVNFFEGDSVKMVGDSNFCLSRSDCARRADEIGQVGTNPPINIRVFVGGMLVPPPPPKPKFENRLRWPNSGEQAQASA